MDTYNHVLARRMWFIPGVVIWGVPGLGEIEYVVAERVDGTVSILRGSASPGGGEQSVAYAELTDYRGNALPATLAAPRVMLRSHDRYNTFVVGTESPSSVRVARDPESPSPVTADLLVIEMGD